MPLHVHLHVDVHSICSSYSGTQPVHTHQLNDIHAWTTDFRDTTLADNETVLFDVLAGDFNLDNSSDGKRMNHDVVTSEVAKCWTSMTIRCRTIVVLEASFSVFFMLVHGYFVHNILRLVL